MKPFLPYSILAAAAASGLAFGQAYTTPVGYVTHSLPANGATLVGLTVQSPTVIAGVVDSASSSVLSDADVNFETALGVHGVDSPVHVLELENGVIQEIQSWTSNSITVVDSLEAFVTPNETKYKVRKAVTISDVFGANNSAGLASTSDGEPGTYDEVLVLNAGGTAFESVFYYDDGSFSAWYDSNFNEVADLPLIYTDAFYIRRIAGAPKDLVITGEVKTTPTVLRVIPGNTFVGAVNPAATTLGNSGLSDFLVPDDGVNVDFDKILIQQSNGSYNTYNYYDDGSFQAWYDANFNEAEDVSLGSALVIQSKTTVPKNVRINAVPNLQ